MADVRGHQMNYMETYIQITELSPKEVHIFYTHQNPEGTTRLRTSFWDILKVQNFWIQENH